MDRQVMNVLSKTGTPCSAHQISIAIEEEKAKVKQHQEFRTGICLHNDVPELIELPLTDTENARIIDNVDNVSQDEQIATLLTKTRKHRSVQDSNGYEHRAERLREDSGNQGAL